MYVARIRAEADGLVAVAKPFHWTGSGHHESLHVITAGCRWTGTGRLDKPTNDFNSFHAFTLDRPRECGEEVTLQFHETWFDARYFFSPFVRLSSANPGQQYAEVAVRLPVRLEPFQVAEVLWPEDKEEPPRRVRELDNYEPGTWRGIHVPNPIPGTAYGFMWRSGVYEGRARRAS
jgi:hypothetical protein